MLERLIKSKALLKILKVLLTNGQLHLREIARRADVTPIYVRKELDNIKELGLAKETRKANLSLWEINKESPIYKEVRMLFLKTELIGERLRNIIKKFNVEFAFIYGSLASGKEEKGSDADLFIAGELKNEDEFLKELASYEQQIGREINYVLWSPEEFRKRVSEKHHLIQDLKDKPIIWIWGKEDEFRRLVKRKVD